MAYTPAVGDMPAFTAEELANAKAYFNQVGSLDQVIQEATAAGYTPEQVASLYAQSMPEQCVGYDQANRKTELHRISFHSSAAKPNRKTELQRISFHSSSAVKARQQSQFRTSSLRSAFISVCWIMLQFVQRSSAVKLYQHSVLTTGARARV